MDHWNPPRSDIGALTRQDFGIAGRRLVEDQSASQLDEGGCGKVFGRKQFASPSIMGEGLPQYRLRTVHDRRWSKRRRTRRALVWARQDRVWIAHRNVQTQGAFGSETGFSTGCFGDQIEPCEGCEPSQG